MISSCNVAAHRNKKSELDLYLAEPVKRLNENIDILDFWSKSVAAYPELVRMARDILVLPVSVASKYAFSLSKKVIEALMCIHA
jgi:hypothetical protein